MFYVGTVCPHCQDVYSSSFISISRGQPSACGDFWTHTASFSLCVTHIYTLIEVIGMYLPLLIPILVLNQVSLVLPIISIPLCT